MLYIYIYMYIYNRKTLDAESSTRGSFVEKKILCFRKFFGKTTHTGGLFFKRQPKEPLQNMR